MIGQEDQKIDHYFIDEEQIDPLKQDFSHITKQPYLNKVFCWIEGGKTDEVKKFFDTFPHLTNDFLSPNNWNPFMYAARYGNMELIDYFCEKSMKHTTKGILNIVSIVHTAVYSGEVEILEYILNKMKMSANPIGCQISPLKVAMKANNVKMVELLIAKGAYYVFNDVFNNVQIKPNMEGQRKFQTLQTKEDLNESLVVEDTSIKDCPIKQTLRFARVKAIFYMRKCAQIHQKKKKGNKKFEPLAGILTNQKYMTDLIKITVGKGNSVLHLKEAMVDEGKDKK